jgi:RNA polymerase sigma-70 factor (ECF subfamily)
MTEGKQRMEEAEFNALYQRHGREVWAAAYARRMDANAALDVAQEAFLRLWREAQDGQTIHNPRAWLLRVARNLAEDHAKSAFQRNGTLAPQSMVGLLGREPMPLAKLVERERYEQVRAVLNELAAADREVLTLRYALDKTSPEIAEIMGVNVSAVHMRLTRARQRLAERLKAQGVDADHEHGN